MRLQSLHVLLLVKSENTCDDLSQRQERNEEHWKDMVLFGLCTEEISIKVQIWPNIWTWGESFNGYTLSWICGGGITSQNCQERGGARRRREKVSISLALSLIVQLSFPPVC